MEIHVPDSPVHSFKDFLIHISVITIGILIALGLDGVRESIAAHLLLRETRANFRDEMILGNKNMMDELVRVTNGKHTLDTLAAQMPALGQQHPDQVLAALSSVDDPNYFFATNSWQAALSSGVLAHMTPHEISDYAWSAEGTRVYAGLQTETRSAQTKAIAFWKSHPHPTPDQVEQGTELILLFDHAQTSLAFVAPQMQRGLTTALHDASQ